MTTHTQAVDLDDEALIERVREAFDHPLIQELVNRYEDIVTFNVYQEAFPILVVDRSDTD